MTSTTNPFKCDYLHSLTSPIPHIFSSEQAELGHLNEQISLLDSHIHELNTWPRTLHDHLCQGHDPSSASHTHTIEDMSCNLQQVINPTASAAHMLESEYLRFNTLPIPNLLSAEPARPAEQINPLESHIWQLDVLRHALQRRALELHNRLSRINALPIEVLSYIFERANDSETSIYPNSYAYLKCIRRAIVLSSVSARFRRVALGTPELWKRVPLDLCKPGPGAISKWSALLQHCMTFAPSINISLYHSLNKFNIHSTHSVIAALLTPETAQKVKALGLSGSACGLWVEKIKGLSLPMLDTLSIQCSESFDLGTLKTVNRLQILGRCSGPSRILPPFLQYLHVEHVSERELISLLSQCSNCVECFAHPHHYLHNGDNTQFNKSLTLNHLKRLTFRTTYMIASPSSANNFQLPSLEFLHLHDPQQDAFIGIIAFCGNLSSTLTTLIMSVYWVTWDSDDLYRLCKLPLPKLRELELSCTRFKIFETAIRMLARVDGECCNPKTCNLPAITSIILRCYDGDTALLSILDLLEEWKIGEAFYYHLMFEYPRRYRKPTRRGLSEWRSYLGSRKIEITWKNCKVLELCEQGDSLRKALQ